MRRFIQYVALVFSSLFCLGAFAVTLESIPTNTPPQLDGRGDDLVWKSAPSVQVNDAIVDVPITLQSVHTDQDIYFLVSYPDKSSNLKHQNYHWDTELETYVPGNEIEDTFLFKWSMVGNPGDLTLSSLRPYEADIWFWKAYRTDPIGYADDKYQIYSQIPSPKAKIIVNKDGELFFLRRIGDQGSSAYYVKSYEAFSGDVLPQFGHQPPTGSRSDIQAKGDWDSHRWTIEFKRKLVTNNSDDVSFSVGKKYLFGVSRYEIAGRDPDPQLGQPFFGSGDISTLLELNIVK